MGEIGRMGERKQIGGQAETKAGTKSDTNTGANVGAWGEAVAQEYLRHKGYRILAANFRTRFGEIDIIARDAQYIVFVEVKTRRSCAFGLPREAVTWRKQQKILLAAQEWLQQNPLPLQPRFDVIEVYSTKKGVSPPSCHHIENAFEGA